MTFSDIDIPSILDLARRGGRAIMDVYARDFAVEYKADHSPLTAADHMSNQVITEGLRTRYPDSNMISEENRQIPYEVRRAWHSFWLIDPLDGTKEFVRRNGEFTVNIALIEDGVPTFGVVYAPVPDVMYYGLKGNGSYKISKGVTTRIFNPSSYLSKTEITVVASRSHMNPDTLAFIADIEKKGVKIEFLSVGSSLKFCLVAEGAADVYPRFGPTMEWDTGAAHAVALYAGRHVVSADDGEELKYNKPDLLNPGFIVG